MVVVTTNDKIQGKLCNRGKSVHVCATNHSDNIYLLLNFKTRQVIKSRDLIWLDKTYGIWNLKKGNDKDPFYESVEDEDLVEAIHFDVVSKAYKDIKAKPLSKRVYDAMK